MTTDERITDDLAIVGRTSRARPVALEATLAKVIAPARPAPTHQVPYVHATRVARTCAGIAAIASVSMIEIYLWFVHGDQTSVADTFVHMPKPWAALCVLGVVSTTHVVASRLAMSGAARDPSRALRWSIAASIGGVTAFCLFFGMAFVVAGEGVVTLLWDTGNLVLGGTSVGAAMIAAVVIARTGIAPRRWMLPVGLGLLVATIAVGLAFGVLSKHAFPPSLPLRVVLTVTGTVALFLIVTKIVLHVHELDDQYSS